MMVLFIFWGSLALLFWTFAGYPFVVIVLSRWFPSQWHEEVFAGPVSMVVAAHNEEEVIRDKAENCLQLDFGPADAEIFLVSDGSVDGTNAILDAYSHLSPHLQVIAYHPRAGKANALNVAVAQARGEVLVFSDANVLIDEKSCQHLLAPFADPSVGVVCGRVLVKAHGTDEIAGESLYMRYEAAVQHGEALLGGMIGVDGALFAMRRGLYQPLRPETILDDFTLSMHAPAKGLRIVYEPRAKAVEEVIASAANEFKRKARIVAGGYQFLAQLLNSRQSFSPWVWCAFFSHKILRWLAPFCLIFVFVANLFLLSNRLYGMLLVAQVLLYALAVLGCANRKCRSNYLVYLPYYFCVVNAAAFMGFLRFLRLHQGSLWEKVAR